MLEAKTIDADGAEIEYDGEMFCIDGDMEPVRLETWVSTSDDPDNTILEINCLGNGTPGTARFEMVVLNDTELDSLIGHLSACLEKRRELRRNATYQGVGNVE